MLKPEIIIKIKEKVAKLFEPIPKIADKRLISKAGFAACKLLSRLIFRGKFIFAIGDFVVISKAVISAFPNSTF